MQGLILGNILKYQGRPGDFRLPFDDGISGIRDFHIGEIRKKQGQVLFQKINT